MDLYSVLEMQGCVIFSSRHTELTEVSFGAVLLFSKMIYKKTYAMK